MSEVCLKVRWGPTKSYKLISFDRSRTCQEIVQDIEARYELKGEQYYLYSPPTDSRGAIWLEPDNLISDYDLQDRDSIEMKYCPKIINLCISETGNNLSWLDSFDFNENNKNVSGSIQVDLDDPINEYIPVLRTMISNLKEEYFFVHLKEENNKLKFHWLNSNVTFSEQNVPEGSFILVIPLSSITGNKRIEAEVLQLPAEKSGFLTKKSIKTHKVTNPKKRWCVLRGNFLYYYASQSQTHANGVIPLEYYDLQQNRNKQKFELTLIVNDETCFVAGSPTYVLECDDEKDFRPWFMAIIRKCVIGAGTTVFGVPLSDVMSRKASRNMVPAIITKAVEFLRAENRLKLQGLFRLSGSSAMISKLKDDFDRGLNIKFDDDLDPNVVAGLLKLYVRELPEPLLPFHMYTRFTSVSLDRETNEVTKELRGLLTEIPKSHRKVLTFLLKLLREVSRYAEENLMTVQNLAVVFGPNILRPREESAGSLGDTTIVCAVTEVLINNQAVLFQPPPNARSKGFKLPPPQPQRGFVPGKSPRRGAAASTNSLLNRTTRKSAKLPSSPPPNLSKSVSASKIDPPPTAAEVAAAETTVTEPRKAFSSFRRATPSISLEARPDISLESLYELLQKEREARSKLEQRLAVLEAKLENM